MKEFMTAVQAVTDQIDWIEFSQDGYVCRAVRTPSDGQVAFLMGRSGRHTPTQEKIAAILNFFDSTLDDETQVYISGRLLDPKDPFGLEEVQAILHFLMEEWSGNPTGSYSGSTTPPSPTGAFSNPVTPGSTF